MYLLHAPKWHDDVPWCAMLPEEAPPLDLEPADPFDGVEEASQEKALLPLSRTPGIDWPVAVTAWLKEYGRTTPVLPPVGALYALVVEGISGYIRQ